ncbi:hypothetical protein [Lawsonella clevelandensis]|uniref:hypothetical protein n=1 Tax=Lawsonella clevelandensis TaxID=1528099 RepID=UPI0023F452F1|nr:hypothetical protein [Lawsonella clevelandensis]
MSHPEKPKSPLRFQPLGEADPEAWRRLQAADPVFRHAGGDGPLEQPNMDLLDNIIAGRTSAELPISWAAEGTATTPRAVTPIRSTSVHDGVLTLGSSDSYAMVRDTGNLAGVAKPPTPTPVEAPEVQRVLDDEANAPDATTSQHIIISMAAEREKRDKQRRSRGPFFGGIAAAAAAVAVLVGVGQVVPNTPTVPRAEAQTLLRNAGAEARHTAVNVQQLPNAALLLHRREVVRHFNNDGIIYNVTTNQRIIMDASRVETQVSQGELSFDSPAAQAKWKKAGSPTLFGVGKGYTKRGTQQVQIGGATLNVAALSSWPTEPNGLENVLSQAIPGVQPSRSALLLLTIPGLDGPLYHGLYQVIAREAGSTVVPVPQRLVGVVPDGAVTVRFAPNKVSTTTATLTFDPKSGQVYAVEGATPQDTLVLVEATGFLNCVDTEGPRGPKNIYLGCATGAFMLTNVSWREWASPTATGRGTAVIIDCEPSCAEGKKHEVPVIVKLSNRESCGYGVTIYTTLDATFPEGTKGLAPRSIHESFPCPISH